jgi:hypothetical protein
VTGVDVRRQDVGLHPLTQKGCHNATQSPSVCVEIASGKTPGNWLGSIARLATVLQGVVATQPAADAGRRQR